MQDLNLLANDNRGKSQLEGGFDLLGWDEVQQGSVLPSFNGDATGIAGKKSEERDYSGFNSYTATVASWRVKNQSLTLMSVLTVKTVGFGVQTHLSCQEISRC